MIILKYVVLLYVVHGFAVVIHEMGHYIIAKFLIKSWDEICIGNFFHIKCSSKVKVSPFIFSAYVGVDSEEIFSKCFKRRRIEISTIPLLKFLYAYFMSRLLYF